MKLIFVVCLILPLISGAVLTGGINNDYTTSLDDPNVKFAVDGINSYYKGLGDSTSRTAVRLVSASSQVVSGTLYRYTIELTNGENKEQCDVRVWSQPWLPEGQRTVLGGAPKCTQVKAPSARSMLGAPEVVSITEEDVQSALGALEQRQTAQSNGLVYLKAVSAKKITKQVVNGLVFSLTDVTFYGSSCSRTPTDRTTCSVAADASLVQTCSANIWYSDRNTPNYKISNVVCHVPAPAVAQDAPSARAAMPGGPEKVSMNDEQTQMAVSELEKRVNAQCNCLMYLKAKEGEVTKQVVNGLLYQLKDVKFYSSSCYQGAADTSKCTIDANATPMDICSATVYYNSRQTPNYDVSNVKCRGVQTTRSLLGGDETVSFNDDDVQKAFQVVAEKVNSEKGKEIFLKGASAQVTKQIVNGVNYKFSNVDFYKSTCNMADGLSGKECTVSSNALPVTVCTITVWYKPTQTPQYQITSYQCS
ncbi:uncharacterized protein LOC101851919 [Aplysia californica]|uniref:Uncharacterized protein LOC101851919 n=1 Tax=Aplysia californica TaxID=6500 RepID=A0ABM0KB68_APLCA|nr:uncharacterized protein LOC101851919 [Aplysia californica]